MKNKNWKSICWCYLMWYRYDSRSIRLNTLYVMYYFDRFIKRKIMSWSKWITSLVVLRLNKSIHTHLYRTFSSKSNSHQISNLYSLQINKKIFFSNKPFRFTIFQYFCREKKAFIKKLSFTAIIISISLCSGTSRIKINGVSSSSSSIHIEHHIPLVHT